MAKSCLASVAKRVRSSFALARLASSCAFLAIGLVERGLKWPGVDLGQKISLFDHLAFVKGDLHDLAVDPGPDQNGIVGLDLADTLENDRKIRALHRRHSDNNRNGAACLRLLALPLRRGGLSWTASKSCRAAHGRRRQRREAIGLPFRARRRRRRRLRRTPKWRSTRTHRASLSKAFLRLKPTARDEAPSRIAARRAGFPSTQRFPHAGSYGKSAYTILLRAAGPHQPNLTGRVPFAPQAFRRICADLK